MIAAAGALALIVVIARLDLEAIAMSLDRGPFAEENLSEIVDRAWPLVCAEVGIQGPRPTVRSARSRELRYVMERNLRRQGIDSLDGGSLEDLLTLLNMERDLSLTYAIYDELTKTVLVLPEAFEGDEESGSVLRGVIVHELVHAADDDRYDFASMTDGVETSAGHDALDAVIEGHAQQVARRVCGQLGWSGDFEQIEHWVPGLAWAGDSADSSAMDRVLDAGRHTSYVHGERFMDALVAMRGDEGIARAFREPPPDMVAVFHPEWYLDPSLRPQARADLVGALDVLEARIGRAGFLQNRFELNMSEILAGLSAKLGEESFVKTQQLLGGLLSSRGLVRESEEGKSMTAASLYEFIEAAEAREFASILERVEGKRVEDDVAGEGGRFIGKTVMKAEDSGFEGVIFRKSFEDDEDNQQVVVITGSLEALAFRITRIAARIDSADFIEVVNTVLVRALGVTTPDGVGE